jgi:hypothetical protein
MEQLYRKTHVMNADPDYRRDPQGDYFCNACHKAIDPDKPHRVAHVIEGGDYYLHPEDELLYEPDGGDCGMYPLGNCCAKKLGLEWSTPVNTKKVKQND